MNAARAHPVHVSDGSVTGTISAGLELTVEEWEEITAGWRDDERDGSVSGATDLPLGNRIALLLECALAGSRHAEDGPGIDPIDDPDDPWPF